MSRRTACAAVTRRTPLIALLTLCFAAPAPSPASAPVTGSLDGFLVATAGRSLREFSLYEVDTTTLAFRRLTEDRIIASMSASEDEIVVSVLRGLTQSIHRLTSTGLEDVASIDLYGSAPAVSDDGLIAFSPMDGDYSEIHEFHPETEHTRTLIRQPGRMLSARAYLRDSLLAASYDADQGTFGKPITESTLLKVTPEGDVETVATVAGTIGIVHAHPAGVIAFSRFLPTSNVDEGLLTITEIIDERGRRLRRIRGGWLPAELSPDGTQVLLVHRSLSPGPLSQNGLGQAVLAITGVEGGPVEIIGRLELPTTSFAWLEQPVA